MPKSKHLIPGSVRSTYEFIKAHRDRYSVHRLCRVLEMAVSGYYDWLKQPLSNQTCVRAPRGRDTACGRCTGLDAP
jgi:hypothetical protein